MLESDVLIVLVNGFMGGALCTLVEIGAGSMVNEIFLFIYLFVISTHLAIRGFSFIAHLLNSTFFKKYLTIKLRGVSAKQANALLLWKRQPNVLEHVH